jgi:phage terminase large subunit-like protein
MTAVTLDMADALDDAALARWRADPINFIETALRDPETRKPFVLSEAERQFLALAFTLDDNGRLKFPELVFGAIKKSGKTTLAAIIMLTMVLLFGGRFAEAYCVANDLEQAVSRVFTMVRRVCEASPLLRAIARITADRVLFPALDASIIAIASDAASAAGGNPTITCFDELWGYTSERSRRLWDEMITTPARRISARLVVSYAGFSGESILLEELHRRGMALPEVAPSLHAGDGMLFAWHTEPIAPWQTESWLSEMRRSLRPSAYARMICNEFVSSESAFVDLSAWDQCVLPDMVPLREDKWMHVWCGIDASVKRDSTALVLCGYDKKSKCVRLVAHRVFTPSASDAINFETVEATVLEWRDKFLLRKVYFDPFQMVSVAQRLARAGGVKIEEFPQTVPNLTAATSNLYDLIQSRSLALYPDAAMRLAISRAIMHESSRGWRLDKLKQQHKIDVVVALSMAALAAVRGQGESSYVSDLSWVSPYAADPAAEAAAAAQAFQTARWQAHLHAGSGGPYGFRSLRRI